MKIKRLAKRIKKQAKKDLYKTELRKLQNKSGDNVELYRFEKDGLRKKFGLPLE